MRNRILVVDPRVTQRQTLAQVLTDANYFVIATPTPEKALERIWNSHPDLIVTANEAAGMSALQFVTFLRSDNRLRNIPITLISEPLPSQDVVSFYRAGIDEYVDSSVPAEELLARIRALLRRVYFDEEAEPVYEFDVLRLQTDEHRVFLSGEAVALTRKEFALLKTLMSRPNKVVSPAALMSSIWGYDRDVSSKTLQVHINRLRRKIGIMARCIVNFPGVGYTFSTDGSRNGKRGRV